ncbi:type II toxin-antitoxin system PemK/MazF family toxin [Endozoicomonas euniceicola]|uniref:Type II toxin-antitoxin system PemK/MazF family toxin n=1 Tax=Endozoicomonas euniceicola TaxID=1234143 RepID=A0ABY6H2T1_9GAMM|nr:type II toxin-antitoxin system PemK/MazF family toxin [Endozoicomonas euniceicola]UYM18551.1 type II toxin-antitoxin system PemK/MazF family toxin [Endozoicomonas euniceicola]
MGIPAAGTIVTIDFPFSDLSATKRRPALVLAQVSRGDIILCQITSKAYSDPAAVPITLEDFSSGQLNLKSFARPCKLFTAHSSLIRQEIATLKLQKFSEVTGKLRALFSQSG